MRDPLVKVSRLESFKVGGFGVSTFRRPDVSSGKPAVPTSKPAVPVVMLAVSRVKALTRTAVWGAPAAICSVSGVAIYQGLSFAPSGMYNRLVEYSIAVCLLPIVCAGAVFAFLAVRWFLLAVWPRGVGIIADEDGLVLRLGSFGTRRFDAARLDVKYPFEQDGDLCDSTFEAFLPEEQQRSTLLPRITCPGSSEPINFTILRFVGMMENDAAAVLRPWVEAWQARHAAQEEPAGESET